MTILIITLTPNDPCEDNHNHDNIKQSWNQLANEAGDIKEIFGIRR